MRIATSTVVCTILLTGCSSLKPEAVVTKSDITVEDALASVGRGLGQLKQELAQQNINTGMIVDEVTLTLNLTAKASEEGKLAVDISRTLASGAAGLGGKVLDASIERAAEGARGSTLVIKMRNAALVKVENPDALRGQTTFGLRPVTGR